MSSKKTRTVLSLLLVSVLLLTTLTVSPAVTCAADNDGQIDTPVVAPRAITKEEIYRYGKGKGRNASRIPVLTYHRILADGVKASPEYANDRYAIAVSEFTKQMQWLRKKKYRAITCDQLYLWRMGKIRLPKRSVLITIDDGHGDSIENALPVLSSYGLRATAFIIGKASYESDGSYFIRASRIKEIQETYPGLMEFQSHTYDLHISNAAQTQTYQSIMTDAAHQRNMYGFEYLAYPCGGHSPEMIRAYKDSGVRMAFVFGKRANGYATRRQNVYKMKRLEVPGNMKLKKFKKLCR